MLSPNEEIESWREDELERMGYSPSDASLIANTNIDLHELEQLLKKGCPPLLAIRILAE